MIFGKKKNIENHAKKFDRLITGLIVGGAVASMIGLSKTNRGKRLKDNVVQEGEKVAKEGYRLFGKTLVKIISIFNKKK